MTGKYWIDIAENKGNSFFKMLEGLKLNEDEEAIFHFMEQATFRYENIELPPRPRLNVCSMDVHLPQACEKVSEALMRCCVLTGVFVPIKDIAVGEYKKTLPYRQRHAMWKGACFKGIASYGADFIEESLSQKTLVADDLFELHNQMNVKCFSVKNVYISSMNEALKNSEKETVWTSKDEKAIAFCQQVFDAYPDLKAMIKHQPKMISHAVPHAILKGAVQKTL